MAESPLPVSSPKVEVDTVSHRKRSFTTQLQDEVDLTYAYLPLLLYCFVSGLSDSVAFNAAGVFVSMQTGAYSKPEKPEKPDANAVRLRLILQPMLTLLGNTIFLALGASDLPAGQPRLWLKAIVSIGCFQAGAFVYSQFRRLGSKKKWVLFASCFAQAVLVLVAAALSQAQHVVPAFADVRLSTAEESETRVRDANAYIVLLPIGLLAFNFGGQIYTSRVLGYGEVPTNVLTSLYCDLFSDPQLFAPITRNAKRNRRIAAAILTLVGGIVSGWLQRTSGGMPTVLWIAAGFKLLISFSWLVWPAKRVKV